MFEEKTDTNINIYKTQHTVTAADCDNTGRLGVYQSFRFFQDVAGTHAAKLGISQAVIGKRRLFWIAVKTRIRFARRPSLEETVNITSWPTAVSSFKSDRCYRITEPKTEQLLVEGRTQWAVINMDDLKVQRSNAVFPPEIQWSNDSTTFDDFPRFSMDGVKTRKLGEVKVASMDIDMGNHMNNANYIRSLLNCFNSGLLEKMDICDITAVYKASAHEGDVLEVVCGPVEADSDGLFHIDVAMLFADGTTSFLSRIVFRNKTEL